MVNRYGVSEMRYHHRATGLLIISTSSVALILQKPENQSSFVYVLQSSLAMNVLKVT